MYLSRFGLLLLASTLVAQTAPNQKTDQKQPDKKQADTVTETKPPIVPEVKDADSKTEISDSCPIAIVKVDPTGNDSFGHAFSQGMSGHSARHSDGHYFVLKVNNTSGKPIRGMKFQAAYYDATEDLHDIPIAWNWSDPLPANSEKSFRWPNELYRDESLLGWKVRLLKVLYEDGTKWEPLKENACSGEFWRSKKHGKVTH
jgi:hypothetical protein